MAEDLIKKISDGSVVVLRAGEEVEYNNGFYAPASITLIKKIIEGGDGVHLFYDLVDAGCFGEESVIRDLLKMQGILPRKIDKIFITHNHPDHVGTISQFKNADVYMPDSSFSVSSPNSFRLILSEYFYKNPGNRHEINSEKIDILSTPGHSGWDLSVLYKGKGGNIAIVGDLFWSQKDWEENSEFLGLCVNPEMQKRSRDYIRTKLKPDVIVPGHGPAFAPKY